MSGFKVLNEEVVQIKFALVETTFGDFRIYSGSWRVYEWNDLIEDWTELDAFHDHYQEIRERGIALLKQSSGE